MLCGLQITPPRMLFVEHFNIQRGDALLLKPGPE